MILLNRLVLIGNLIGATSTMEVAGEYFFTFFCCYYFSVFSVPKEKFIDYITTSNDYKHHFDPATIWKEIYGRQIRTMNELTHFIVIFLNLCHFILHVVAYRLSIIQPYVLSFSFLFCCKSDSVHKIGIVDLKYMHLCINPYLTDICQARTREWSRPSVSVWSRARYTLTGILTL